MEDRRGAGGDFDALAGPWVAGGAGLAVPDLEGPESPDLDALSPFERVLHGIEESVHHEPAFLLGALGPTAPAARSTRSALVMSLSTLEVWSRLVVVHQQLAVAHGLFVKFAPIPARREASPVVVRRATA